MKLQVTASLLLSQFCKLNLNPFSSAVCWATAISWVADVGVVGVGLEDMGVGVGFI